MKREHTMKIFLLTILSVLLVACDTNANSEAEYRGINKNLVKDSIAHPAGRVYKGKLLDFSARTINDAGIDIGYKGISWHSSIDGDLSSEAEFSTSDLSLGEHTITFSGRDRYGNYKEKQFLIIVEKLSKYFTAKIKLPLNTYGVYSGQSYYVHGELKHPDGSIEPNAYKFILNSNWASDKEGVFLSNSLIRLIKNPLSIGNHIVSLSITFNDSSSSSVSYPLEVLTESDFFDVNIKYPLNTYGVHQFQKYYLHGEVLNPNSSAISISNNIVESLYWSSDVNGVILETQAIKLVTNSLSPGFHNLKLNVKFIDGITKSDSIRLEVKKVSEFFNIKIRLPLNTYGVHQNESYYVHAELLHPNSSTTSISNQIANKIFWSSDIDGTILEDHSIKIISNPLSVGVHNLKFNIKYVDGITKADSISLEVKTIADFYDLKITEPINNSTMIQSANLKLNATLVHPDQTNITITNARVSSSKWRSSIDGIILENRHLGTISNPLSVGTHRIFYETTFTDNTIATDSITITVTAGKE